MSTFTWSPAYGVAVEQTANLRSAKFGDGYEQRVAYGINWLPEIWSLQFNTDIATATAIQAFLAAQGGATAFDWTPPDGVAGKYVCRKWARVVTGVATRQVNATFEQVFGE